jgi:outer membrane protein OmpA-like peptidoglycan-associated protein
MSRIGWIIILILWILLGLWLCNRYICGIGAAAPAVIKDKCETSWNIKDGSSFSAESADYFQFKKSTFTRLNESTQLKNTMTKVANYLKGNSGRAVTVTGYYETDERNRSILPNLGLARANDIKSYLNKLGVPSAQIDTKASTAVECVKGDTIRRGIGMAFGKADGNNDRLAQIKNRLFGKPVIVQFATNSDNINLNPQQRQDFADLFYYLERVNGAKLDVGGHTDNVGNVANNTKLSKDRAEFVKNYLVKNGNVPVNKMDVAGFGPSKPRATNSTTEGKALNRRVEVILK